MESAVSIIIVNWNGIACLPRCLRAVSGQTSLPLDVIVVDNHSTDGSADGLESQWPQLGLRVIRMKENAGFAAANNTGAQTAKGRWLAFLNPDAFPEPAWLENLLIAANKNPDVKMFSSLQLLDSDPQRMDGAGDVYHASGLAWRRGYGRPVTEVVALPKDVFGACAAAAMIEKKLFLELGGFDEDFFCYHEDVDLSFRSRLTGATCLFVPDAVVRHMGSGLTGLRSDFALYHGHRNLEWTFIKNVPGLLLFLLIPWRTAYLTAYGLYYLLIGRGGVFIKAKRDAIQRMGPFLKKRKSIQASRKISIWQIIRMMDFGIPASFSRGKSR